MHDEISIEEEGLVSVCLAGVSITLDIYETQNRLSAIYAANEDKPAHEKHAAVVAMLMEKGFPSVSHYVADRFVVKISELAVELEKKASAAGSLMPK